MSVRVPKIVFLLLLLAGCRPAQAEQDFYGIRMKDQHWATHLVLGQGSQADENDLYDGPVVDKSVFADAVIREAPNDRMDFRVNVVNESSTAVDTDYEYRDYYIYLKNGQKIPLIDPETQWDLVSVAPKKSVTFNPSLGNLSVRPGDIRMIECSFDAGRTRLFLFPASMKETINKLKNPSLPALTPGEATDLQKTMKFERGQKERARQPKPGFLEWLGFAPAPPADKKTVPEKKSSAAKGKSATPVRGLMEWLGFAEPAAPPTPVPAAASKQPSYPASAAPVTSEQKLDAAIRNFKYVPSTGAEGASSAPTGAIGGSRREAHVIEYNKNYNYITVDLGSQDGLKPNMTLTILRNGKAVAKASVRQLRDSYAAATVLSGPRADIRPGDLVSLV